MIFFNIGCGILIFSNFMISLIPNKNAIKSSRNPELINKFNNHVNILNLSLILACVLGIIGADVHLMPLMLSKNDKWIHLISPGAFIVLFAIAFIRIHFKLIKKADK